MHNTLVDVKTQANRFEMKLKVGFCSLVHSEHWAERVHQPNPPLSFTTIRDLRSCCPVATKESTHSMQFIHDREQSDYRKPMVTYVIDS